MAIWLMLGHIYIIGSEYGDTNVQRKKQVLNWIFTQVVISSDFALVFFYFLSGFIVMFSLIKKFQKASDLGNRNYTPNYAQQPQ